MAVLEKIRVKFGLVISIIIALALLSFIIDPSTLETALNSMSSKYDVGRIGNKAISYTDYAADVERYTTINEMVTGSSVQSEQTQKQIRDAAWQELLDRYLFVKNAKAAGIAVGEEELVDATTGDNLSPVVLQNPAFYDESGSFSKDALIQFVQNVSADETGRLKLYWNYLQNTIYNQRFYAKYNALYTASAFQNALEKERIEELNNGSANIDFAVVNFPFQKDSTIKVSSPEIRKYYKAHKKNYRQQASRDVEYVVFEVKPSAQDKAKAEQEFTAAYEEFAGASNLKTFLVRNSERQLDNHWYKAGELNSVNREINDFVFGGKGKVSPIIRANDSFYAVRVVASAKIPDQVYVKHILLQGSDAAHTADSLLAVVTRKPSTFAQVAAQWSADQGSRDGGELGNIGWMSQSSMIPGFESILTAKVGKPYIINTQYGTHIILVSEQKDVTEKKQVAILEKTVIPSAETTNAGYAKASRFASLAGHGIEGYRKAVDSLGVYSHSLNVKEDTDRYGSITQAKEITRWVFDAGKNKVSDIISLANSTYFVIAAVKEINKEGFTPIAKVAPAIHEAIYSEKFAEKQKADILASIEGMASLEEMAEKLGTSVNSDESVSFSTMGMNQDPALLGAAFTAPIGEIKVVSSEVGTYLLKVNSRDAGSFYTAEDADLFASQKAQYNSRMILPAMMEEADVKDNRARFY